ncbi:uncharacterized protein [Diadema antillarum]|uniref:uncharacterized protein n=1 Tax=Diadema antillarum TaxID=105358 RepID=UPI003A867FEB
MTAQARHRTSRHTPNKALNGQIKSPSVRLVGGPSPLEGFVFLIEPDSYVCYDGFNDKAAELICGELGFPAAEEYSYQTLPSTATSSKAQRLLKCPQVSAAVCGPPDHASNGDWSSNITRFGSMITLTCGEGYVINGSATLQCVARPGWSTYLPVWNDSVPSCQAVGETAIDGRQTTPELTPSAMSRATSSLGNEWQEEAIRTASIQTTDSTFNKRKVILELTPSAISRATPSQGNDRQEETIRTASMQTTDYTSNDRQTTLELTPSPMSRAPCRVDENVLTYFLRILNNDISVSTSTQETKVIYSLGSLLCFVLAMLVLTWVGRCKKMKKHPADPNRLNVHPNEGPLQMHPTNVSFPPPGTTDQAVLLHSTSADSSSVYHSVSEHPGNLIVDAHHIYQNSLERSALEKEMDTNIDVSGQADFISQPFRDVFHQDPLEDDRDDAQLQNTADISKKEFYMDMSGNVKEKMKRNATIVQSRDISAIAEDTDENGYLLSHVSSLNVTGNKSNTGCSTMDTCDIGSVPFCGDVTNNASSIHSSCRNLIDCARSGNLQSLMYEEIPSHSEQSARSQEQRYCRKNSIVAENEACLPFAMGLNDPLYSVSIYSSKQTVEPSVEVDENAFLVLETTDTGEIVGDQLCVSKDTSTFSPFSPETDRHRAYNPKDRCNSRVYESITVT